MTGVIKYSGFLVVAALLVIADQLTKQSACQHLFGQPAIEILPVFKLVLVFNRGAAFGFLSQAGGWQHWLLISLAIGFSLVLLVWMWRQHTQKFWLTFGLALVLAGAIGNLIDRINLGYVIDFIALHYQNWYFPVFNVADVCITIGAIILIADSLFFSDN